MLHPVTASELRPMFSAEEFAHLVGMHPRVIVLKCRLGEIPSAVKVFNRWRIPAAYVDAVVNGGNPEGHSQK